MNNKTETGNNNLTNSFSEAKNTLKSSHQLFFSMAIAISAISFTNIGGTQLVKYLSDRNLWATNDIEYTSKNLFEENFQNNTLNLEKNEIAKINTINFSDESKSDYLKDLKQSLLNDIKYYKDNGAFPLDILYSLVLKPENESDFFDKKHSMIKYIDKAMIKALPSISYETQINKYTSSAIISMPKKDNNLTYEQMRDNINTISNCQISLVHRDNNSMIDFHELQQINFIPKEPQASIPSSPTKNKIIQFNYSKMDTKMFQEFILLHEYFHCLSETNNIDNNLAHTLFGYSELDTQSQLSEYMYSSLHFIGENSKGNINHLFSNNLLKKRNFEKYVDTLAAISMINRYMNKPDVTDEELSSLNTVFSDFFAFRLRAHLFDISSTHGGFEIFNLLSKQKTLETIKNLKSFEEINKFALETIEKSNAWRSQNHIEFLYSEVSLIEILSNIITDTLTFIIINDKKYLNKDTLLKSLLPNNNSFHQDIFNAIVDEFVEDLQNPEKYMSYLKIVVDKKTNFPIKKDIIELYQLITHKLIYDEGINFTAKKISDQTKLVINYYLEHKEDESIKKINSKSFEAIMNVHLKQIQIFENFYYQNNFQNKRENAQELLKKFGTYPFSYDYLGLKTLNNAFLPTINSNHSLVLLSNMEKEFFAYKNNIKSYKLDIPDDNIIELVSKHIYDVSNFDFDTPTILFINKRIDSKIRNILHTQNDKHKVKVHYDFKSFSKNISDTLKTNDEIDNPSGLSLKHKF